MEDLKTNPLPPMIMHIIPTHWVGLQNFHHAVLVTSVYVNMGKDECERSRGGQKRPGQAEKTNKLAKISEHGKEGTHGI